MPLSVELPPLSNYCVGGCRLYFQDVAGATSSRVIQQRSNKEHKDKLQQVNTESDQDPREKLSEQIRTVDEQ
jgi:hypothetical protein